MGFPLIGGGGMLDTFAVKGANWRGDGLEAVLLPGPGDKDLDAARESL